MKLNAFTLVRPKGPRFSDPVEDSRPARAADLPPVPANTSHLFDLGRDAFIEHHSTPLRVPPVPARIGAQLMALRVKIARGHEQAGRGLPDDAEIAEYQALITEAVRLIAACLRPCSTRTRLARMLGLWRPLRHATGGEIGELLSFLVQRQATSSIRYHRGADTAGVRRRKT